VRRLLAGVLLFALPLPAQQLPGFRSSATERQLSLDSQLIAVPDSTTAGRHAAVLSARPHVAGTPAQIATADYVLRQMASWGLDTMRVEFEVFLPFHDSTIVELLGPRRERLALEEPAIAEDPFSGEPFTAMNGYSGSGDVTAEVVYVNYGLRGDYRTLDSLGISVAGKVAIARYGRSYRGIKAREAELHGAAALIIYSDPGDDGYTVGEVYPAGPMRNENGVQRGSIFNGNGDPSTPGWASVPGARRLPVDSMGIARIPVVPMSYGNAAKILARLEGPSVPQGWQGGLGFRYHVGGAGIRVRVGVWPERGDRALKRIQNTFGIIRGSEYPDEVVIVGGHRDAWGHGAIDNVSGVVSILEAARAWGEVLRSGNRPSRTLVFATWDAEEWGLVGAFEWAELMAGELDRKAIAYINQDVTASGYRFGASGSASLRTLIRDVAQVVDQPADTVTIYAAWRGNSDDEPQVGGLGGGSDFVAFHGFLGIPSLNFGFGGPGGIYHSAYDTRTFVERFGDPGYRAHTADARLLAVLMARLANATVIPYEYSELGEQVIELVEQVRREPGAGSIATALDRLGSAGAILAQVGRNFAVARNGVLWSDRTPEAVAEINSILRQVERQMLDPEGLPGRPALRHQIFAPDRDNGYANVPFPAIAEALRDGDSVRAAEAARFLAERVTRAAALMDQATRALPTDR
jgi:N-acetylated-alpha-linked acidic dipeptidase